MKINDCTFVLQKQITMSKYSVTNTKQDFETLYNSIENLEKNFNLQLDWKKIKSVSYDEAFSLKQMLYKKIRKEKFEQALQMIKENVPEKTFLYYELTHEEMADDFITMWFEFTPNLPFETVWEREKQYYMRFGMSAFDSGYAGLIL